MGTFRASSSPGCLWGPAAQPGWIAHVYTCFTDGRGKEPVGTEVGETVYDPGVTCLPIILMNH
jgi:hypothetical protein